jgi:hypothetical protein
MPDNPIILDIQGEDGFTLDMQDSDGLDFEAQPFSKGDPGRGDSSITYVQTIGDDVTLLVTYSDGTTETLVITLGVPIPTALSELSDDALHRLVTDSEKSAWNESLNAAVNSNECLTFWHASDVI